MVLIALIALLAGEAVASAIGLSPEAKVGVLEVKEAEGFLETVFPSGIASTLVTWTGFLLAGVAAMLVTWAGLLVPREKSLATSISTGLMVTVLLFLAWLTSGQGILAGLTAGVVMFLSSLAARQQGAVRNAGTLAGMLYFLFAVLGITNDLSGTDAAVALEILELCAVGSAVGLVLLVILHFVNAATGWRPVPEPAPAEPPKDGVPTESVPFFARGPVLRYAIVRGVLLGIGMGIYQGTGNHTVFWVMLAIWVVLQPVRSATWEKAARRGVGILAGCLVVGALAQVVTGATLIWIALVLLLVGLTFYRVNYSVFAACLSFVVVAMYGDATTSGILHWGLQRVLDNGIGILLALLSAYLVLPGDGEPEESGQPSTA